MEKTTSSDKNMSQQQFLVISFICFTLVRSPYEILLLVISFIEKPSLRNFSLTNSDCARLARPNLFRKKSLCIDITDIGDQRPFQLFQPSINRLYDAVGPISHCLRKFALEFDDASTQRLAMSSLPVIFQNCVNLEAFTFTSYLDITVDLWSALFTSSIRHFKLCDDQRSKIRHQVAFPQQQWALETLDILSECDFRNGEEPFTCGDLLRACRTTLKRVSLEDVVIGLTNDFNNPISSQGGNYLPCLEQIILDVHDEMRDGTAIIDHLTQSQSLQSIGLRHDSYQEIVNMAGMTLRPNVRSLGIEKFTFTDNHIWNYPWHKLSSCMPNITRLEVRLATERYDDSKFFHILLDKQGHALFEHLICLSFHVENYGHSWEREELEMVFKQYTQLQSLALRSGCSNMGWPLHRHLRTSLGPLTKLECLAFEHDTPYEISDSKDDEEYEGHRLETLGEARQYSLSFPTLKQIFIGGYEVQLYGSQGALLAHERGYSLGSKLDQIFGVYSEDFMDTWHWY